MTDKQKIFCDEYLIDFNESRDEKVAYPDCKTDAAARANSSRLLTNDNIQEYLKTKRAELGNKMEITQERVLKEMARIAFGDVRKLYDDNGSLKFIKNIDEDAASIIAGIETAEAFEGYGEDREMIGYTKKVKLADKAKALDMLGKYFGMFKDKIEIDQNKPFEVNIKVKK